MATNPANQRTAERVEAAMLFFNVGGPFQGVNEIAEWLDMTRGEANYTLRKSGQFVRVGPNGSYWAAGRKSKLWTEQFEKDIGHPAFIGDNWNNDDRI